MSLCYVVLFLGDIQKYVRCEGWEMGEGSLKSEGKQTEGGEGSSLSLR